jgi:hypothetical protein
MKLDNVFHNGGVHERRYELGALRLDQVIYASIDMAAKMTPEAKLGFVNAVFSSSACCVAQGKSSRAANIRHWVGGREGMFTFEDRVVLPREQLPRLSVGY